MGTGERARTSSSGATGGLNASASAFVFAPRRCPAAADVVVERGVPVPVDELASLGLVSEEDADAHVDGVEELEREGVVGGDGSAAVEKAYARYGEEEAEEGAVGATTTTSDGGFEDSLAFLESMFPNFDSACLEEALMNTGGDVELAMELLMDDEVPEVEAPDVDDVEAFPTLGGGVGTATTETEPEPLPTKIYLSGGRSNVNKASTMLNNWQTNGHASSGTSRTSKVERGVSSGTKTKIEWVETGAAVSQLYTANRDEARDYARVRNVCYEQATNAYISGNKALAKELSRQGREAAAKMAESHARAANNIYSSRGGGSDGVIDLHGLHVAEAITLLRRELTRLQTSGYSHARILVGTGHHTVGSRTPSRLPVAVETFLQEQRWRFSEPQSGLLEVSLQ